MGGEHFPAVMADHLNRFFHPVQPLDSRNIITAAALTAIHEMLGYCLGDPGDSILTTRPVYGRFELDFGNTDALKIVYSDAKGVDPFSPAIIPELQATLDAHSAKGGRVRALLIVNPNNPLGMNTSVPCISSLANHFAL